MIQSAALMSLVVSPLAVGLGAVASTIVVTFFDERWQNMAPMLTILSIMTVFRPMTWPAVAYLQAIGRTGLIMWLSLGRALVVLACVAAFGIAGGPLFACAGACVGYALHAIGTVIATGVATAMPIRPYLWNVARPLIACVSLFAVTTIVGAALASHGVPGIVSLVAQIACGAAVYVAAAYLCHRSAFMDLLRLAATALGRGRQLRAGS